MMISKRQYTVTNIKGRMVKYMIYFIELMNKYDALLISSLAYAVLLKSKTLRLLAKGF